MHYAVCVVEQVIFFDTNNERNTNTTREGAGSSWWSIKSSCVFHLTNVQASWSSWSSWDQLQGPYWSVTLKIIIIANCPQENLVIVESASPTATLRSCKPEQSGTDWLAISAERQRMNPDLSRRHFFIGQISRHRRLLSTHLWKYWQLVVTLCVQLRFLQSKFIDYYELAPLLATQRQVCSHG